jgi:hypothetical protein
MLKGYMPDENDRRHAAVIDSILAGIKEQGQVERHVNRLISRGHLKKIIKDEAATVSTSQFAQQGRKTGSRKTKVSPLTLQESRKQEDKSQPTYAHVLALGADDHVIQASLRHGMALEDMGSLEGAARLFGLALSSAPDNVVLLSHYGRVQKLLRNFTGARRCYAR